MSLPEGVRRGLWLAGPQISDRGAGVARAVFAGSGWWRACGPGGAGCAIGRLWSCVKSCEARLQGGGLVEKEGGGVRAWGLGGGRRGERPGRRGVRVACGVGAGRAGGGRRAGGRHVADVRGLRGQLEPVV